MYKAKRIDGKGWVEGRSILCQRPNFIDWYEAILPEKNIISYEIDPSTLCEQVGGEEFFEGDELRAKVNRYDLIGFVVYVENSFRWAISDHIDGVRYWLSECKEAKPTGRNKHD